MKKIILCFAIFSIFLAGQCKAQTPPKCDDVWTKEMVGRILDTHFKNHVSYAPTGVLFQYYYNYTTYTNKFKQNINYSLDNIKTESFDQNSNSYNCSADIIAETYCYDKKLSKTENKIEYVSSFKDNGEPYVGITSRIGYYYYDRNWKTNFSLDKTETLNYTCGSEPKTDDKPEIKSENSVKSNTLDILNAPIHK